MMTNEDYHLMIHICQHSLRKGHDLTLQQVQDIDKLITKIYNEKITQGTKYALVRSKKVGKRTRIHSN